MLTATTIPRRLGVGIAAMLMALALALAIPAAVSAHGCGTADHWYGGVTGGPHYYEGQVIIGNSRFNRWWEVSFGSGGYNYTWCGCVNPYQPCVR